MFFKLLDLLGGYSYLKQAEAGSVLSAEIIAGTALGSVHACLMATRGLRRARGVTGALMADHTLLLIISLWPTLATNYSGLPPQKAVPASMLILLGLSALFVGVLFWLSESKHDMAMLTARTSAGAAQFFLELLPHSPLWCELCFWDALRIATYECDGTENEGEDLPSLTPNDRFYEVRKNNVAPDLL